MPCETPEIQILFPIVISVPISLDDGICSQPLPTSILLPTARTREEALQNKRPPNLRYGSGGLKEAATPQDSFRRRVKLRSTSEAGFLAFGSSRLPPAFPSFPDTQESDSGRLSNLRAPGVPLADYSGGTAADFHGFPSSHASLRSGISGHLESI
jgi:hypothetical protein